tara:strand:- start:282 stop:404 length:123 start_codon:yes stop_codon:yes gene_type:complete
MTNYLSYILIQLYYNKDLSRKDRIELTEIVDEIIGYTAKY